MEKYGRYIRIDLMNDEIHYDVMLFCVQQNPSSFRIDRMLRESLDSAPGKVDERCTRRSLIDRSDQSDSLISTRANPGNSTGTKP